MSAFSNLGGRLYRGETEFSIVGRRKLWYVVALAIILLSVGGLLGRGFNLGIEFKGGSEFRFPANGVSVSQVRDFVASQGVGGEPVVQTVGGDLRVQTPPLDVRKQQDVAQALQRQFNLSPQQLATSAVGSSWGGQITRKALQGLIAFLVAVVIYISIRFEPKMAAGAFVALIHDLVITAGIYALVGFVVTPATVIGLLTILGYSLYDTVVVFDKVQENTRAVAGGSRRTYGEAANLAVNQTLARSINTSLIALLPVAGLLFVGAGLLGAGTLKDLSLALFIGIAAGTYSSIFIATPVLVDLKEREPQYQALTRRVAARRTAAAATNAAPAVEARPATASVEQVGAVRGDDAMPGPVAPAAGATATGSAAVTAPTRTTSAPAPARPVPPRRKAGRGRPSGKRKR